MEILQVISQGAISAPMYSMKGPSMIQSNYPTAFPLKHQQKASKCIFLFDSNSQIPVLVLLSHRINGDRI
jgi:3-hydroxyisobutyrate dehydrogenase-like beta-hydroxyacid dehydrogenase